METSRFALTAFCIACCSVSGTAVSISGGFWDRQAATTDERPSCPQRGQDLPEEGAKAPPPSPHPTDSLTDGEGPNVRVNQDASGQDQGETTLAVNPTDPMNVVGGAMDSRDGYWKSAFYHTHDGGHTWEDGILPLPWDHWSGDPTISFCANGSVIYIDLAPALLDDSIALWAYRSDDGGRTWPLSQREVDYCPEDRPSLDKPWVSCDATDSPWKNQVYAFCSTAWDDEGHVSIRVYVSSDLGETWTDPMTISDQDNSLNGAYSGIGPEGQVYVCWMDFTTSEIRFDRSLDGGANFGEDITVRHVSPVTSDSIEHLPSGPNSLPLLAVDSTDGPHSGNIYIVWTEQTETDLDILFVRSTDGGLTWSEPIRPTGDAAGNNVDQWGGTVTVDSKGRVVVSWLDTHRNPGGPDYEAWAAISRDGGAIFDTPFVLSDTLSLGEAGRFTGHYMGVTASPDSLWTLWPDMRSGTEIDLFTDPYPNIFDYDEVQGVRFEDEVTLTFDPQDDRFGEDLDYDVLSGTLADLLEDRGFDHVSCLVDDLDAPPLVDEQIPDAADGLYYLVRVDGPAGVGTYGDAAFVRQDVRDTLDEAGANTCP